MIVHTERKTHERKVKVASSGWRRWDAMILHTERKDGGIHRLRYWDWMGR